LLTEPERYVAARVAQGARNAEIAKGLGLSVKTVEKHLSSIIENWPFRRASSSLCSGQERYERHEIEPWQAAVAANSSRSDASIS